jgi:hypothetical protein
MEKSVEEKSRLLSILNGLELSAVAFVRDYLQLQFDGPLLNVMTEADIIVHDKVLHWMSPGFRDALCEQIGLTIAEVHTVTLDQVTVKFSSNAEFCIPLIPTKASGPECIYFSSDENWFVI